MKDLKTMPVICIPVVTAPGLSNICDHCHAGNDSEKMLQVYDRPAHPARNFATFPLWIAVILAIVTGFQLLTGKSAANKNPGAQVR